MAAMDHDLTAAIAAITSAPDKKTKSKAAEAAARYAARELSDKTTSIEDAKAALDFIKKAQRADKLFWVYVGPVTRAIVKKARFSNEKRVSSATELLLARFDDTSSLPERKVLAKRGVIAAEDARDTGALHELLAHAEFAAAAARTSALDRAVLANDVDALQRELRDGGGADAEDVHEALITAAALGHGHLASVFRESAVDVADDTWDMAADWAPDDATAALFDKSGAPITSETIIDGLERLKRARKPVDSSFVANKISEAIVNGKGNVVADVDAYFRRNGSTLTRVLGGRERVASIAKSADELAKNQKEVAGRGALGTQAALMATQLWALIGGRPATAATTAGDLTDLQYRNRPSSLLDIVTYWKSRRELSGPSVRTFARELSSSKNRTSILEAPAGTKLQLYIVELTNEDDEARKFDQTYSGLVFTDNGREQLYPLGTAYEPATLSASGKSVSFGNNAAMSYKIVKSGSAPAVNGKPKNRDIHITIVRAATTTPSRVAVKATAPVPSRASPSPPPPASRGNFSDLIDVTSNVLKASLTDDDCYLALSKAVAWIDESGQHASTLTSRSAWETGIAQLEEALTAAGYNTEDSGAHMALDELRSRYESY